MITVSIDHDGDELGVITIEKLADYLDGTADYSARFSIDRVLAVGVHQRPIRKFPRLKTNALGLLLAALMTLDEREMSLEDGVEASDLAGKERRTVRSIRGPKERRRNHYRPAFWD